jgi:hypothetical protein
VTERWLGRFYVHTYFCFYNDVKINVCVNVYIVASGMREGGFELGVREYRYINNKS